MPHVLQLGPTSGSRHIQRFPWVHPHGRRAVKDWPADVVPQTLVVKHEFANPLRELVTLPVALESPGGLTLAFWRGSTCGLDRISGGPEFVRGDVCDGPGLASGVRGMPRCPTSSWPRPLHGRPPREPASS